MAHKVYGHGPYEEEFAVVAWAETQLRPQRFGDANMFIVHCGC